MSLIKWTPMFDPFEEMDNMLAAFPGMGRGMQRAFFPATDVYQTKDAVVVEAPLAGVDPRDVEVNVDNGVLTIKGETRHKKEVDEKDYYRKEIRSGSFYRQIALPASVDEGKVQAEFEDGILKITCPKAEPEKKAPVKIEVKKK